MATQFHSRSVQGPNMIYLIFSSDVESSFILGQLSSREIALNFTI